MMGQYQPDIAVYDQNNNLVLSIEVTALNGTTPEWATKTRRNFLAHGLVPQSPYFLMAMPDRFFLWTNPNALPDQQPDYVIDAEPLLKPYFEGAQVEPKTVYSDSFELLLSIWLHELILADTLPKHMLLNGNWLIESGLWDSIRGGDFSFGEAA